MLLEDINNDQIETTVLEKLIEPVLPLIEQSQFKRTCKKISDHEWVKIGIVRTVFQESSGRGFLQSLIDMGKFFIKRSNFFETLKSKRRLSLCADVSQKLLKQVQQDLYDNDPLKRYSELSEYDIYAGDGHYHSPAAHDPIKDGKKYPALHFYSLDLRTHGLSHLTTAKVNDKRKTEHDMHALKRLSVKELRQNAPKGRKVIYVWDRAGIDFDQWYKWKHSGGIYFISREKKNMKLKVIEELKVDHSTQINNGVDSYEIVESSNGKISRRISYTCQISGERFTFLTNLINIAPGLIAHLYKLRWDVEKVFDQIKNKMFERKAWATSSIAKTMQAEFVCLSHNLMLLLEDKIKKEENIENVIELKRQAKRFREEKMKIHQLKRTLPIHLFDTQRFTVRSIKFIRWLRNTIFKLTLWTPALDSLRLVYDDF